jgi:hypothetical protein
MTRDEALADLAASISTGEHGSQHLIDGAAVSAVRRSLTTEEAQAFSGSAYAADGLLVEGFRMTVEISKLPGVPVVGGTIDVDGVSYDVKSVLRIGIMVRITCARYLA